MLNPFQDLTDLLSRAYDVIITILLFWKLIPLARHNTMSGTLRVLFRDGALYCVCLFYVHFPLTHLPF